MLFCLADNVGPSPGARARCDEKPFSDCGLPAQGDCDDSMLLDDTQHTTYIHDLERELAESDTRPGTLILLPLAERLLTVPDSVLSDDAATPRGKELVLYTDPSSLSVPREQDSVRRAIIESRARARARKTQQSSSSSDTAVLPPLLNGNSDPTKVCDDDPMDIDS